MAEKENILFSKNFFLRTPRGRPFQITLGLLAIVFFLMLLCVLWRLCFPPAEKFPLSLFPSQASPMAWSYQIDQHDAEPLWSEDGFFVSIPAATPGPVTAQRILTEEMDGALLQFMPYGTALQVFLDDQLLYTDFPTLTNELNNPLPAEETDLVPLPLHITDVFVTLPENYVGRLLTVVTYCRIPNPNGRTPCFPTLCTELMLMTPYVASSVLPLVGGTLLIGISVFLLMAFLFSAFEGAGDPTVLLLALFSFLCSLVFVGESWPVINVFGQNVWFFQYANAIYVDALLLFFALRMRKWPALILSLTAIAHMTLSCLDTLPFNTVRDSWFIVVLIIVVALLFVERKQQFFFRAILYALLPFAAALVICTIAQYRRYYNCIGIAVESALFGNWFAFKKLICTYLASVSAIFFSVQTVRQQTLHKLAAQSAQLRNDYTTENIRSLERSLEDVRKSRHEYLHHLETINALSQQRDYARLNTYLESLIGSVDRDTPLRYSENPLINAIISSRFRKAHNLDIHTKAQVQLSTDISMEDTDLTILLANILDNALEAAAKVPDPAQRSITLKIGIFKDDTLFIGCQNSSLNDCVVDDQGKFHSTKLNQESHGYGLEAIRRITKKYHGTLVIYQKDNQFSLKSCLHLPASVPVK